MPKVRSRYLAFLREETKKLEEEIELSSNSTINDYINELFRRYNGLRRYLLDGQGNLRDGINVAVNGDVIRRSEYGNTILKDGDEVVVIPPIAGGSSFF
ncbi:MAG: MoaD/ThiS family protein [Aigarchaeota archaeon]|nr:MoaD/ThiS family protein [Aigarchaeota archaeon]MCX8193220.1 MoaD/ThiS family protein [Nitrososphaeria archaeon]MDW7986361.1 ubiquitin-like small modifier protein 1 [Nitrososphaerota archaeon]